MVNSGRNICLAVLAAGQSVRFTRGDKLAQPFHGKMLGLHICEKLNGTGFARSLVIAASGDHPCAQGWREYGFDVAVNDSAADGMGTSVALAARLAARDAADGLLICLADMPFVPAAHFARLTREFEEHGPGHIAASYDGCAVSPPALFGATHFPQLARLNADKGAKTLLAAAQRVSIAPELLIDIDTAEQFDQMRKRDMPE